MKDLFEEIWIAFKMNRLRTFLTGFAIAWGIFMLVALLAAGNGLQNGMIGNFRYMTANSVSLYSGVTTMPYGGMQKGRRIRFSAQDIEWLSQHIEGCKLAAPVYDVWDGKVNHGKININCTVTGVNENYKVIRIMDIVEGRFINAVDIQQRRKVVILHRETAAKLFPEGNAVGQYVKMANDMMFQIVGTYNDGSSSGWQPSVYIPYSTAMALYNPEGYVYEFTYEVEGVTNKAESEAYAKRVRQQLASHFGFDPEDNSAIWISNRVEGYESAMMVFRGISLFIWIIGIGTLIAGVVGISNIMLITVKERTKEFGIRRAIGATPGEIIRLVVLESLTVTIGFGYIGMMLGIGLSELLCKIFPQQTGFADKQQMFSYPTVDIGIIVAATAVLVVAGVIAGYLPAKKAASIKPIDAMMSK